MLFPAIFFVFSVDAEAIPTVIGHDVHLIVGTQHTFVCVIEHMWFSNLTFSWTVNNQLVPEHTEEFHKHQNNTAIFTSVMTYNITEEDDSLGLTCSVAASSPFKQLMNTSVCSAVYGEKRFSCINIYIYIYIYL